MAGQVRGVEIINSMNRVGLLEKMTLEQRLKGSEAVSHVDIKRKRVPSKCQSHMYGP